MTDNGKSPDSRSLADLFDETAVTFWVADDLSAVFRHQMSADAVMVLNEIRPSMGAKFISACSSRSLALKTFGDLLAHPDPPIELLQLMKSFGKAMRNHRDSPLPIAVANMFYYTAIAAAMLRCRQRISELDDVALLKALNWSAEQLWIDEPTRSLLKSAIASLQGCRA